MALAQFLLDLLQVDLTIYEKLRRIDFGICIWAGGSHHHPNTAMG
jgi:hypothetical protein